MHNRSQEERIFGRFVVVVEDRYFNTYYERFYTEKDANDYKLFCLDHGLSAFVHEITSDLEDDSFDYYY